jgi:hypothetical protein
MTNTKRGEILAEAKALTEGDRNESYGDPHLNMSHHANLFTEYCRIRGLLTREQAFTSVDMAECMNLGKIARRAQNQGHKDSYVDGAAYTAIAYENYESGKEDVDIREARGWDQ